MGPEMAAPIFRGPRTTHHPHKRPSSSGDIFVGWWCTNCRNLRKRQNMHHPQFCTRDVDCQFCGGGAWISLPELYGRLEKLRSFCRKTSMPKKFLVLGGCFGFFFGGGKCRFYFYGREDFSDLRVPQRESLCFFLFFSLPLFSLKEEASEQVEGA